ncbi:MAG: response regulator transcription factor [Xanthomonadaceae bacterium]|nr:response regulator transcription factor [Xanthomonadaceae bacterium]
MPVLLIADDHPLFREALKGAVARGIGQAEIHEADSARALFTLIEQQPDADLLLLDLHMPGAEGFGALVHLRGLYPQLPVVVVSAHEEASVMRRAMDHGAAGFIPKSANSETLIQAISAVLDGELWLPTAIDEVPGVSDQEADIAARIRDLTPQQLRVLGMLAEGLLNKQIGYELGVSEATVKAHMTAILRKLGASNRTQAVVLASQLTLKPQPLGTSFD